MYSATEKYWKNVLFICKTLSVLEKQSWWKHGGVGMVLWERFSSEEVGKLVRVDGNTDGAKNKAGKRTDGEL